VAARFYFAVVMATVTLLLNRAFGPRPLEVMLVFSVAAALTAMIGLLIGIASKTATMLFTLIKSLGVFLFIPVIFYLFPEWPQWIAMFFPPLLDYQTDLGCIGHGRALKCGLVRTACCRGHYPGPGTAGSFNEETNADLTRKNLASKPWGREN
jgi:hypothetical protein